ncbi:putative F-box protein [Cardamine amara subsp. amara]|uniref:F-box protein n=1 Tax=Cardamine amara subsp. amara TaxID=228776 RepID=A0ABD1BQE5_CARAN
MNTVYNNPYVVKQLPHHHVPLYPNNPNSETFNKFMNRCIKEENEEVIFRKELRLYYDQDSTDNQLVEGLELMAQASDEGNLEARYVYGLILLCLGGDRLAVALSTLAPLI